MIKADKPVLKQMIDEDGYSLSRVDCGLPSQTSACQSGIMFGYIGLIEGLVKRIKAELGADTKVVATGGLAHVLAKETPVIETVDEMLTLEGLRLIHELNQ